MDGSSSKSNSLSGEEWNELSKSDYAKVIFSNLYWNSDSGAVGCHFKLTETVNKNPLDYIGLYKVGYDNISQCLASKKISELECENDAKLIHCLFKSEELPELNGFYQFLYVTQDNEVSGASMPFAANNFKNRNDSSDDEVITEKIEDDFLMVRYGIEQKNDFLEVMIQRLQNEKLALSQELHERTKESKEIFSEHKATMLQLQTLSSEFDELKKEKEVLISDLETIKEEKASVSCEFEVVKEKIISELAIITKSADDLSNELSTVKVERDNLYSDLEDCKSDKIAMLSKLEQLVNQLKTAEEHNNRLDSELEECKLNNSKLSSELANSHSEITVLKSEKCKIQAQLNSALTEAKREKDIAVQLKYDAETEACRFSKLLDQMEKSLKEDAKYRNPSLWQEKEDALSQLADVKIMLNAMEASKQLVINEMGQLGDKLKEAKNEQTRLKCENILLKINLDDLSEKKVKSTSENEVNKKDLQGEQFSSEPLESEILLAEAEKRLLEDEEKLAEAEKKIEHVRKQLDHSKTENESLVLQMRFVQSRNINMESEVMGLNKQLKEQDAKLVLLSKEKSDLQEELLKSQRNFEEKLYVSKDLYLKLKEKNPEVKGCDFEAELHNLIDQFETYCVKLQKLENECVEKDEKLEQLYEEMKQLKENEAAALNDVAEKTARLLEAAELYKEMYIGKQKLLKKMNKILHNKSKSSLIKVLEDSSSENFTESDFLPLNIKASKYSSSSNSDSDTGEHFCPEMTPLQVKDVNFQTFIPEKKTVPCLQQDCLIQCFKNNAAVYEKSSSRLEQKKETQDLPSTRSDSSKEKMYEIPCSVCEKVFTISSTWNTPLVKHYEEEHKLDMCPVCSQLFEKCVPAKYLNIHINKHFE